MSGLSSLSVVARVVPVVACISASFLLPFKDLFTYLLLGFYSVFHLSPFLSLFLFSDILHVYFTLLFLVSLGRLRNIRDFLLLSYRHL